MHGKYYNTHLENSVLKTKYISTVQKIEINQDNLIHRNFSAYLIR